MEGNSRELPVEIIRQSCNIDWRDTIPQLFNRVEFYCMKDEMADVYFVFKRQGKELARIPGHKFVLTLASEVFQKEFTYENENNAKEEKRSKQVQQIEVGDDKVEIDAFKQMLMYIYSGFKNVELTGESVFPILYIAKKYIIKQLEKECVNFLISNINAENVFSLVQYYIDFEADIKLVGKCKDFLQLYTEDALNSEAFTGISIKCLVYLLKAPYLNISEVNLFKAVLKWANAACESSNLPQTPENIRSVLGSQVIELIRFPTINTKDFADVVVPSKILTAQDERDILLTQIKRNYQPENPLPYSKIPRELEWSRAIKLKINEFSNFSEVENSVLFSKPTFIGGFFWRIKAIRTITVQARAPHNQPHPSLGFFLQCQGKNSDSDPEWTCTARAELKIKSHKRNIADFWRRIEHKFHPQENDWGFRQMMTLEQIRLPEYGFIDENGVVTLSAYVTVDPPD